MAAAKFVYDTFVGKSNILDNNVDINACKVNNMFYTHFIIGYESIDNDGTVLIDR